MRSILSSRELQGASRRFPHRAARATPLLSRIPLAARRRHELERSSSKYRLDDIPMNVGQTIITTLEPECQLRVVKAEQMQDGCIEIVDVDWV